MTDREMLLKQARHFETVLDADDKRDDQIESIKKSLSEIALREVEDEARVRAMQKLETYDEESRTALRYDARKRYFFDQVIGEWYIDQKKPIESRTFEQVEA